MADRRTCRGSGIKTGLNEDAQQFKLSTRKGASRNGGVVGFRERKTLPVSSTLGIMKTCQTGGQKTCSGKKIGEEKGKIT